MDAMTTFLAEAGMTTLQALMLVALAAVVALLLYATALVRAGRGPELRPIRAFEVIRTIVGRAADAARPVHLSIGVGGIADASAGESLAGVAVLQHVSREAAASGAPMVVTVSDPTLLPLAQEVTQNAWDDRIHRFPAPRPDNRLVAPEPTAYAVGTMDIIQHENVAGNVLVGRYGQEYLLMGEAAARAPVPLVAGAQRLDAMPFVHTTTEEALLGEDMYAAGAYLDGTPAHVASLRVQDWMRVLVAAAILVGVVLRTAQVWR